MKPLELLEHTDTVNELLARYGVKFGIYKNNVFKEQLFPFDAIPRMIEAEEFAYLEKGLKQRVVALNLFLKDIYSKKQIVKDGVIPEDYKYVLEHFDDLVLKDVAEAGGYGVVFGNTMTKQQKDDFLELLKAEPRRFIAQEVIDFQDLDILEDGEPVPRKADLRAFVLMADEPLVWKSGLTRFSRNPDSFIVNSSQGGGFKDTWVLSQ